MFNPNWKNDMNAKSAEYMREAENSRLAAEARNGQQNSTTPIYAPLLATVGEKMMHWGEALHTRYSEIDFREVTTESPRFATDDNC